MKPRHETILKHMYPSPIARNRLRTQAYRLLEDDPDASKAIIAMVVAGVPLAAAAASVAAANRAMHRTVLDIGKRASMELTAEKYGFSVDHGDGGA